MKSFSFRKLSGVEVNEQYQLKIAAGFVALGNCDDTMDMIVFEEVLEKISQLQPK